MRFEKKKTCTAFYIKLLLLSGQLEGYWKILEGYRKGTGRVPSRKQPEGCQKVGQKSIKAKMEQTHFFQSLSVSQNMGYVIQCVMVGKLCGSESSEGD